MFAPSRELVQEFVGASAAAADERHRRTQELLRDYILKKFAPNAENVRQRVLLLVLRGENAVLRTRSVTGRIAQERSCQRTVHPQAGCLAQVRGHHPRRGPQEAWKGSGVGAVAGGSRARLDAATR